MMISGAFTLPASSASSVPAPDFAGGALKTPASPIPSAFSPPGVSASGTFSSSDVFSPFVTPPFSKVFSPPETSASSGTSSPFGKLPASDAFSPFGKLPASGTFSPSGALPFSSLAASPMSAAVSSP